MSSLTAEDMKTWMILSTDRERYLVDAREVGLEEERADRGSLLRMIAFQRAYSFGVAASQGGVMRLVLPIDFLPDEPIPPLYLAEHTIVDRRDCGDFDEESRAELANLVNKADEDRANHRRARNAKLAVPSRKIVTREH